MEARQEGQYYRAIPVIEQGHSQPSLAADIKSVFSALTSRWLLITFCILVALTLGIGYLWTTAPTYDSTAEILLDPRERKLVESDLVASGLGTSSQGADTSLVESQVEILKSRSVLTALIARENLESDPQFGGSTGQSLPAALVKGLLYGPNSASYQGMSPFDRAMTALVDAIKVERVGNTYVLRITVTTLDPVKAANLANGLAELYLAEGQSASQASSQEAAGALEARLTELRQQSDDAQRAVEQYRAENGLLGVDGVLVDEQQLRDLNDQVTKASIETQAAKSKFDEAQRLSDAPVSATAGSSILSSPLVEDLRTQLDAARGEEISLAGIYGDRHPQLIVATEKRRALEQGLADETGRIISRAESEYEQARQNEAALRALLADSETRRATANSASIQLRELERQADSTLELLQSFSVRAGQIREQTNLPTNNARIISPAVANSQPSGPRLVLSLAVALILGSGIGIAIAWLLHILNGTPQRPTPQQRTARLPTLVTAVEPDAVPRSTPTQLARDEIMAAKRPSAKPKQTGGSNPRQRLISGLFR